MVARTFEDPGCRVNALTHAMGTHMSSCRRLLALAFALALIGTAAPANSQSSSGAPVVIVNSGHSQTVGSMAFSPDGHWLVSGSDDAAVKIWDAHSGRLLRTL